MTPDVDTKQLRIWGNSPPVLLTPNERVMIGNIADTIDALRARVAELDGRVAGYEAEMIAAADYLRESKVIIDNATEAIRLIGDENGGGR